MNKEMYGVKIFTDGSDIIISQQREAKDENRIVIHPDQVDIIVSWLNNAQQEIQKSEWQIVG